MSRNPEYQFVSTNTDELNTQLIAMYEAITKRTLTPSSPDRLFIQWVTNVIIMERVQNNYTGNQNIPSRAERENLDALGELFYSKTRPAAQAAKCTERFYISAPQDTAILVPEGTQVTDASRTHTWKTTTDTYVTTGSLYADVMVQCQTVGTGGNGYAVGQINTIMDMFDYAASCENITKSDGGADTASDDEYYELMRASEDAYSDAGAKGGYIYFAKSVSKEIADVVPNSPTPGHVHIHVLMSDGTIASDEIKASVLIACNEDFVRPLTDYVITTDPETVAYDIDFTYYIPLGSSRSASEVEAAIEEEVRKYKLWQSTMLGRDINPSELHKRLMTTGIKRVDIRAPTFMKLRNGMDNTIPQVAAARNTTIVNGGYEDE